MKEIYCVGSINIDQVCVIGDGIGESKQIVEYCRSIGGKGANQAEAVLRAGVTPERVHFWGKVGSDSEWILSELEKNNFRIREISICPEVFTGQVIINHYENGRDPTMHYYAGANANIKVQELLDVIKQSRQGDILMIQNEIAGTRELMQAGREHSLHICFNPSPGIDPSWDLSDYSCTWLILNEHECRHLCKLFSLNHECLDIKLLDSLKTLVKCEYLVVTQSEKGAMGLCSTGFSSVPAIKVDRIVDTVGAGDTFAGYFIAVFLEASEWNLQVFNDAIERAVHASGLKVQKKGAFDGIPFSKELKDVALSSI